MANKTDADAAAQQGEGATMLGSAAKVKHKGGKENCPPSAAAAIATTNAADVPAATTNNTAALGNGRVVLQLPFEVNTRVKCKWRDDEFHWVKIIERRKKNEKGGPEDYEYYVHYQDCKWGCMFLR